MTNTHMLLKHTSQKNLSHFRELHARFAFETQVWINLKSEKEATEWLNKMQQHNCVTYHVTRTKKNWSPSVTL